MSITGGIINILPTIEEVYAYNDTTGPCTGMVQTYPDVKSVSIDGVRDIIPGRRNRLHMSLQHSAILKHWVGSEGPDQTPRVVEATFVKEPPGIPTLATVLQEIVMEVNLRASNGNIIHFTVVLSPFYIDEARENAATMRAQ